MQLQGTTYNVLCRVFPKILEKKVGVIGIMGSLLSPSTPCKFNQQFTMSKIMKRSVTSLLSLELVPSESLPDFLKHFNEKKLQTKDRSFDSPLSLISR